MRFSSDDPLLRTWFIVYDQPGGSYSLAAIGHKMSDHGGRRPIHFKGFWSTQDVVAHQLGQFLQRVVNPQYIGEKGVGG